MRWWRVDGEVVVCDSMFAESGSGARLNVVLFAALRFRVESEALSSRSYFIAYNETVLEVC
jgi:hypothetical protein